MVQFTWADTQYGLRPGSYLSSPSIPHNVGVYPQSRRLCSCLQPAPRQLYSPSLAPYKITLYLCMKKHCTPK